MWFALTPFKANGGVVCDGLAGLRPCVGFSSSPLTTFPAFSRPAPALCCPDLVCLPLPAFVHAVPSPGSAPHSPQLACEPRHPTDQLPGHSRGLSRQPSAPGPAAQPPPRWAFALTGHLPHPASGPAYEQVFGTGCASLMSVSSAPRLTLRGICRVASWLTS